MRQSSSHFTLPMDSASTSAVHSPNTHYTPGDIFSHDALVTVRSPDAAEAAGNTLEQLPRGEEEQDWVLDETKYRAVTAASSTHRSDLDEAEDLYSHAMREGDEALEARKKYPAQTPAKRWSRHAQEDHPLVDSDRKNRGTGSLPYVDSSSSGAQLRLRRSDTRHQRGSISSRSDRHNHPGSISEDESARVQQHGLMRSRRSTGNIGSSSVVFSPAGSQYTSRTDVAAAPMLGLTNVHGGPHQQMREQKNKKNKDVTDENSNALTVCGSKEITRPNEARRRGATPDHPHVAQRHRTRLTSHVTRESGGGWLGTLEEMPVVECDDASPAAGSPAIDGLPSGECWPSHHDPFRANHQGPNGCTRTATEGGSRRRRNKEGALLDADEVEVTSLEKPKRAKRPTPRRDRFLARMIAQQQLELNALHMHYRSRYGGIGPVGRMSFAFPTIMMGLCNTGRFPVNTLAVSCGLMFGGLIQFIIGLCEFARGNTFPQTSFLAVGAFWAVQTVKYLIPDRDYNAFHHPNRSASGDSSSSSSSASGGGVVPDSQANGNGTELLPTTDYYLVIFIFIYGMFFLHMAVAAARTTALGTVLTYSCAVMKCICLAIEGFNGSAPKAEMAAGVFGIITGCIGCYMAASDVANEIFGRTVIPIGPMPKLIEHFRRSNGFRSYVYVTLPKQFRRRRAEDAAAAGGEGKGHNGSGSDDDDNINDVGGSGDVPEMVMKELMESSHGDYVASRESACPFHHGADASLLSTRHAAAGGGRRCRGDGIMSEERAQSYLCGEEEAPHFWALGGHGREGAAGVSGPSHVSQDASQIPFHGNDPHRHCVVRASSCPSLAMQQGHDDGATLDMATNTTSHTAAPSDLRTNSAWHRLSSSFVHARHLDGADGHRHYQHHPHHYQDTSTSELRAPPPSHVDVMSLWQELDNDPDAARNYITNLSRLNSGAMNF